MLPSTNWSPHPPFHRPRSVPQVMPIRVTELLTVLSLGKIDTRLGYHTARAIYPVGYTATREFTDFSDPTSRLIYSCEVREGPAGPSFAVTPRGADECAGEGPSPQAAWNAMAKKMAAKGNLERPNRVTVPGAELFGLTHPVVLHLLQARCHHAGEAASFGSFCLFPFECPASLARHWCGLHAHFAQGGFYPLCRTYRAHLS